MKLLHQDCIDALPEIPDQSVDMVLCDLPYGTTRCRWDVEIDLEWLWAQYRRICKGAVVLFAQTPFDKRLGCSNLRGLRYEWVWHKTHPTGHLNAKRAPMKARENILVFCDRQPPYYPIKTSNHVRKVAVKRGDKTPVYGAQTFDALAYDSTDRYPRSVITFASDKQTSKLHPTQKPLALCEYLVRTHSREGELVLDNCMGSGTTGVACKLSGRRFIGIEKDATYFGAAVARIDSTYPSTNHQE